MISVGQLDAERLREVLQIEKCATHLRVFYSMLVRLVFIGTLFAIIHSWDDARQLDVACQHCTPHTL